MRTHLFIAATLSICVCGCAHFTKSKVQDYTTISDAPSRNSQAAQELHDKALVHFDAGQYEKAETYVNRELIQDVGFGPAHNTLGTIYYLQGKFYLAAWEFELALREMPDRAQPHNNLGLVYEAVGKLEDALIEYHMALSISPDHPEYLGNLARTKVRLGQFDDTLGFMLERLALIDDRHEWRMWAREQLEVYNRGMPSTGPPLDPAFSNLDSNEVLPPPLNSGEQGTPILPAEPQLPIDGRN